MRRLLSEDNKADDMLKPESFLHCCLACGDEHNAGKYRSLHLNIALQHFVRPGKTKFDVALHFANLQPMFRTIP